MAQSKHRIVGTLIKHYIYPSEQHNKEVYLEAISRQKSKDKNVRMLSENVSC